MELFDSMAADSQIAGSSQGGMPGLVMSLLNSPEIGGISGLMSKFTQAGLGEQVASWISQGQNVPITGEQLASALGSTVIQVIAAKLGINGALAANMLAGMLPQLVNQMTPGGELPASGSEVAQLLSGLFGSKPV